MPSITALSPYYFKAFHLLKNETERSTNCTSGHYSVPSTCANSNHSGQLLFRLVLQFQTAYAQYVKLLTLFMIAVIHAVYMIPFLNIFAAIAANDVTDVTTNSASYRLRHLIETLTDYKKNMWMIVGSMCVSLSTSCFILMLNASSRKATYEIIVRGIDLLAFGTLPVFLFARFLLLSSIHEQLTVVFSEIRMKHNFEQLSTTLGCSFTSYKQVPLCTEVIENALFPAYIIKFLIVLAILTIVYILLAYFIEWCLKHWFPPRCSYAKRTPIYVPIVISS
ncbi:unnamed protein product [Thelazia callipaeda]|uniref:G-protein coupled receptors family 1 profile domain-containing protein n=1 Tax=Thelazia callipaeda TaxID=103827 RepID=A0A0N5CVV5_THECL|nr:unnamed protein product [Thelazia callipaeda]